jgi:hypothetical protein
VGIWLGILVGSEVVGFILGACEGFLVAGQFVLNDISARPNDSLRGFSFAVELAKKSSFVVSLYVLVTVRSLQYITLLQCFL